MKFRSLQHHAPTGKINVTPLIDVVMVLIVFYLIVGQLAADRRARVDLPATAIGVQEEGASSKRPIVITLSGEGGIATIDVDGSPVADAPALATLLKGLDASNRPVHVRADRGLEYGSVGPLLDACRQAGVASVKLATRRAQGEDR
jgi:biopolymer transport protein ExbD